MIDAFLARVYQQAAHELKAMEATQVKQQRRADREKAARFAEAREQIMRALRRRSTEPTNL